MYIYIYIYIYLHVHIYMHEKAAGSELFTQMKNPLV